MQYRKIGETGVEVSLLSYGTGGPSHFGQKTGLEDSGRAALVNRAIDLGVNLFDTAEEYGESEGMLGRALKGHARDTYLIATKWSYRRQNGMTTDPKTAIRSIEQSLKLLQTDYVDIFQIHGVRPEHYDLLSEIFIPVLQQLKQQGKTRFLGVTEMLSTDPKHYGMSLCMERHPDVWDSVMLKYGIMNQWAAKHALPLAVSTTTAVLNMAPVRLTLTLPEKLSERMNEWGEKAGSKALDWLSDGNSSKLISKGYQFAAEPKEITTVISGTSSIAHLEANIAALDNTLSVNDLSRLKSEFADSASYD